MGTTRHQTAVGATLAGITDRLRRKPGVFLPESDRLDGRTAFVTGANRGLGKGIATRLASLGATVWMACRSDPTDAVAEVRAAAGHDRVHAVHLDLTHRDTVTALVDELARNEVILDVAVFNAGLVPLSARTSPAGIDLMVHVNFLGKVLLVDALREAGRFVKNPRARLIFVGSEAHRSAPPIDWEIFGIPQDYGTRGVLAEYGKSKLFLHTWVCELARRTEGELAVHHLCPGAVNTDIAREAPGWSKPLLKVVFGLFFQTPRAAALPVAWLAAASEIEGQTGVYVHLTERKPPSDQAADPAQGARLWEAAHRLIADRL